MEPPAEMEGFQNVLSADFRMHSLGDVDSIHDAHEGLLGLAVELVVEAEKRGVEGVE